MSFTILLPLLYLAIGWAFGKTKLPIKAPASALLARLIIPLVIIYNIATYRPGIAAVILGVMAIMGIMAFIGSRFTRDPIRTLCFFYLNIGWLGLPVATALFGDGAAAVFIAAYIGSTVFGNAIGPAMLEHGHHSKERILNTLKSPPVISVFIGLALLPMGAAIELHLRGAYGVLKFLVGFIGMTILGMWLAETRIRAKDIYAELLPFSYKTTTGFLLLSLFLWLCTLFNVQLVTQNIAALYLICLLPPAANIVVLETHYRNSGGSAKHIASGTCISIVAIFVYACFIQTMRH